MLKMLHSMMKIFVGVVAILQGCSAISTGLRKQPPHIIFIYADDLGWNDVSFHGSPQIPTPNIDALATSGIVLHNYYTETVCTPSRGALMSGMYPIRLGLQHFIILGGDPTALPLNVTILPQHLKRLGYSTHMVGKWHLGYMKKEHTPTHRGFDSFFGYYNGAIDHFDYTYLETWPERVFNGIDLQNGTSVVRNERGRYATDLFTEKAEDVIRRHDVSKPLFLYFPQLNVHVGGGVQPLQATSDLVRRVGHIQNMNRRIFAGQVKSLDDSVGSVFRALHEKGMLDNCIFVFASDNGGEPNNRAPASNEPLRSAKFSMFEGGLRVPAIVWSSSLTKSRVAQQLMHVSDWLPTLYAAAGGNPLDLGKIDGYNMWDSIRYNFPSQRNQILHGLDPITEFFALRQGDLKVITGSTNFGTEDWERLAILEEYPSEKTVEKWIFHDNSLIRGILNKLGSPQQDYRTLLKQTKIRCDSTVRRDCIPKEKPCLFNIREDPCEYNNIASKYPQVVQSMLNAIKEFQLEALPVRIKRPDLQANPSCHGFAYVPWMDLEERTDCRL